MQRQQPLGDLRFTAPMPSLPVFPSGFQSTFSRPYQDLQPNSTNHHPATIQYMDAQSQSLCAPGYPVSAPPSALSSPALPNEVFFSPFAHEYTSYFSLEATEPPARRNTPFVHRRSRVVMACTYCRRRKIRCDGGDPCTNCAKTCRSCDYTPVPADLNSNRRRRALTETQDISPPNNETDNGGPPSVLSKNDVPSSEPPLPPSMNLMPASSGNQRPPNTMSKPNVMKHSRTVEMAKQAGYTANPVISPAEPALMTTGFETIPPPSVPGQQMQWALVPVWRPDANEHLQSSQLSAPMPGFSSGRVMHNNVPTLNTAQMDPSAVYHSVPSYQPSNIGNPFTTTVPVGFVHNALQLQQASFHEASVRGHAIQQLPHQTHVMLNGTNISSAPQQFSTPTETHTIGQEPRHLDSTFSFSSFNGINQQSSYPLEASSTSTSFSSQGYNGVDPMQACGSSGVGSPPYTPLPQSTISGYSATGHDMFRQQQEDLKQVYAPAMMMNLPPETPALASPNKQHNFMPAQTGMVGLGIMMPGM